MSRCRRFVVLSFLVAAYSASASPRDPTRPLTLITRNTEESSMVLQAIFASGRDKKVVINGKTLSAGDAYMNWRVMSISGNAVQLAKNNETRTLSLRSAVFIDRE